MIIWVSKVYSKRTKEITRIVYVCYQIKEIGVYS